MCVSVSVLRILCLFNSAVHVSTEYLHTECGPAIRLSTEDIEKQASHCNDKKTLSKRVHELSSELFFGVFVKVGNQITFLVFTPLDCPSHSPEHRNCGENFFEFNTNDKLTQNLLVRDLSPS